MSHDVLVRVALVISFVATVACWIHIWRSSDLRFFKIACALIAALPFVGPVCYWFTCLPPELPADAQAPPLPRGTRVREEMTARMYQGWRRYLNQVYGVGQPKALKRRQRRQEASARKARESD